MDENMMYEAPITNEVYCYTSRHGTNFHTLFVGPLLKYFLHAQPMVMKMQMGQQTFIAQTDKPMYLIPYDHSVVEKYALHKETYKLLSPGEIAPPSALTQVTVPITLSLNVAPYFQYKIDVDGKLYKREGDSWKQQNV